MELANQLKSIYSMLGIQMEESHINELVEASKHIDEYIYLLETPEAEREKDH